MRTIDALFERALADRPGDELNVVLDPAFQGLPDMAHGGTVLALFDAAARRTGARSVRGHYRKRVPLGAPLRMTIRERGAAVQCRLLDEEAALLVDGDVIPADLGESGSTGAANPPKTRLQLPRFSESPPLPTNERGHELPVSRACFVCGTANELGLQARFSFDDQRIVGVWPPRAPFRGRDGTLAPVALTALLDEAAFWLGALATGESGMTTELGVTLHRNAPFGGSITVVGDRRRVGSRPDDGRYWDTEIAARDDAGHVLATGRITFVAVRGAARKLANGLLAMNPPAVVRRVFPAYVPA